MDSYVQQVASETNSYLQTNLLKSKMICNIVFNKKTFLNTHPLFNGDRFGLWKTRFKIFIQNFDLELWETIINDSFIVNHCINGEVVDKPYFLWTKEEKRNFKIDFKTKKLSVMSLNKKPISLCSEL